MTIDLTQLPAPKVVEELDYETLLAQRKARLIAAVPAETRDAIAATLELETEPLTILLQENAYTELILRQRINEAAKATMLAYATGTDLDHLAALLGVARLVVTPADPDANPPVEAVREADDRLRYRAQMALEGLSTAGSVDAYTFHALGASALVADVQIDSPTPGTVRVTVLSSTPDGIADASLLSAVSTALSVKRVRPLNDVVSVRSAAVVTYRIRGTLTLSDGPDPEPVLAAANAAAVSMAAAHRKLAASVPLSAVYAALHGSGVQQVALLEPVADLPAQDGVAYLCTGIDLGVA